MCDALEYEGTLTGVRRPALHSLGEVGASAAVEQGMCIHVTELNEVVIVASKCAGIARPAEARRAPVPFSDRL